MSDNLSAHQVLYSIGVRFAGGGIGNIAYHGVVGLLRHGMLLRLLCGSFRERDIAIDHVRALGMLSRLLRRLAARSSSAHHIMYLHNTIYDRWARRQLEPCDMFLSWNGFGLQALRQAQASGAVTAVYRASSHPVEQTRLLVEEYRHWGEHYRHSASQLERAVTELQETNYIVIPSDFVRQSFIGQGINSHKLIQIPFGVDIARFSPADQSPAEPPFRVLFMGQIGVRKGVPYLLQAWKQIGWTDAELWLVGRVQASFEALLRPYLELPGLHLPGYVDEPLTLLRQSHLFVFPTIEEGSALVVYEAMASGLPVITTPNAGSLIRDGHDGIIVPIRDVQQLTAHMDALRADPKRRHELGKAARRRIEPYTWKRYGDTLAAALADKGEGRG